MGETGKVLDPSRLLGGVFIKRRSVANATGRTIRRVLVFVSKGGGCRVGAKKSKKRHLRGSNSRPSAIS